jgi:pyranose oxidase
MQIDVLIIGSGPIGATYARIIAQNRPNAKILMVDAGPKITNKNGQHVKNITDSKELEKAQILSQGPKKEAYPMISITQRAAAVERGELTAEILARAGTHLVTYQADDLAKNEMPAAAVSTNVGGMGSHWTCACPHPGNEERIPFIPPNELDDPLEKAKKILHVTQNAFSTSPESLAIIKTLGGIFNQNASPDRIVQPMPLACKMGENGERYWVGSDVILGDLVTVPNPNFELRSETICRKLTHENGKISGEIIEHLPSGKQEKIEAKIVIVAADALRTPQLLWASGIRPKALGHYLNEHPFIFTFVELKDDLVDKNIAEAYNPNNRTEPTVGVFWVPFDAPNHPFHGQIMHMDLSPMKTIVTDADPQNPKHIVGLGWGCLKEIRFEDCIEFSETETDYLGMPKMNFKFNYTERDKKAMEKAKAKQTQAAEAFGKVIKDGDQTVMPAGTSMHYEGTTRMGVENDGTSVCDTYSKVWDFDNLFVGGNGVIPVSTTSNPTLTSVALAIRSCEKLIEML